MRRYTRTMLEKGFRDGEDKGGKEGKEGCGERT